MGHRKSTAAPTPRLVSCADESLKPIIRVVAYLGGPNSSYRRMRSAMGMKAYLSPGKPIQSLIGPVSPARKTFGQAGNLSGIYTSGAFSKNAWSR